MQIPKVFLSRWAILVVMFIFLSSAIGLSTLFAQGLSENQIQQLQSGVLYFNTDCGSDTTGSLASTPEGSEEGLTFPDVSSNQALISSINNYISNSEPSSPFINTGNLFVAAGQKYNVNPALIIGLAWKEENLGTAPDPLNAHDSFGVTGITGYPDDKNGFVVFPSYQASIDPVTGYVSSTYVHGGYNSKSIYQMMLHYSPDGPRAAASITIDVIHKILDSVSTSQNDSGNTADESSSVSATGCSSTTGDVSSYSPGTDGYQLSGSNAMAIFYQCDPSWADDLYGSNPDWTICSNGCGITSLSMVIDTLTSSQETPKYYAQKYGSYDSNAGTAWSLWPVAAKDYGLTETELSANETGLDQAATVIRQGGLVIISVNAGVFTTEGHLMVIRAVDSSGHFYLANPGILPPDTSTETTGYTASYLIGPGNMAGLFAFTKG